MGFRRQVRKFLELSGYTIARKTPRQVPDHDREAEHYDAIAHNAEQGMDKLFSDPHFLAKYNSLARQNLHRQTLDLILEHYPERSGTLVVGDVGCGPADFFKLLAGAYPAAEFFGYDFSTAVLQAAQHNFPSAIWEKHDIYDAPPRQHNITICSQTLEHLLDPGAAVERLMEMTKPGGLLIMTVPDARIDTYKGHINFWSKQSWDAWIGRMAADRAVSTTSYLSTGGKVGNLAAVLRF